MWLVVRMAFYDLCVPLEHDPVETVAMLHRREWWWVARVVVEDAHGLGHCIVVAHGAVCVCSGR